MAEFNLPKIEVLQPVNSQKVVLASFGLAVVKPKFYKFDAPIEDEPDGYSRYLGTPVFSRVEIEEVRYINPKNVNQTIRIPGMSFDNALIEVQQSKEIVNTVVQGLNGSVKEYITDNDYDVVIKGIISGQNPNQYPKQEVENLISILKSPTSIAVNNTRFLQLFSIFNLVVWTYSLPQVEGLSNIQPFEIRCLSDTPIELRKDA